MCLKALAIRETFAHVYSQNSGVYSTLIRLFILDGQNLLVFLCFFFFTSGLVMRFQGGNMCKITLLVVNVAQLY